MEGAKKTPEEPRSESVEVDEQDWLRLIDMTDEVEKEIQDLNDKIVEIRAKIDEFCGSYDEVTKTEYAPLESELRELIAEFDKPDADKKKLSASILKSQSKLMEVQRKLDLIDYEKLGRHLEILELKVKPLYELEKRRDELNFQKAKFEVEGQKPGSIEKLVREEVAKGPEKLREMMKKYEKRTEIDHLKMAEEKSSGLEQTKDLFNRLNIWKKISTDDKKTDV